jgi:hypothetical protein
MGLLDGSNNRRYDDTSVVITVLVGLLFIVLVVFVAFKVQPIGNAMGAITGNTIFGAKVAKPIVTPNVTAPAEIKTIKNIAIQTNILTDSYEIPINNLDLELSAEECEIITPSADINVKLQKPMTFKGFTGTLKSQESSFYLIGKLNNYLTDIVKINWKTNEDLQIRVVKGSVQINQIEIPHFDTMATGDIMVGGKASLSPSKDPLKLDYFRGVFNSTIVNNQSRLMLKGTAESMSLGSQDYSFNIG